MQQNDPIVIILRHLRLDRLGFGWDYSGPILEGKYRYMRLGNLRTIVPYRTMEVLDNDGNVVRTYPIHWGKKYK